MRDGERNGTTYRSHKSFSDGVRCSVNTASIVSLDSRHKKDGCAIRKVRVYRLGLVDEETALTILRALSQLWRILHLPAHYQCTE